MASGLDAAERHGARVDGDPRRAVTSLNLRHEEKADFDLLQAHWGRRFGRPLKQWDAFSLLLSYAVSNPLADVPEELRR